MKLFLSAILLVTLSSCRGSNRDASSGGEEKFARVYAMLVMVSSNPQMASSSPPERILADAGMTREEFRKTVAEYNRDPQRWAPFIEKVQKIIEEETARTDSSSSMPGGAGAAESLRQPSQ
jgi:hypothetical protein